jgi:hypothetical protein
MADTASAFMMEPVVETRATDFSLWPVAAAESRRFLPLSGRLTPDEVGLAVMLIARSNDIDPDADDRPSRPAEPVAAFLHGLLTYERPFVPGGLRVVDTATGITFEPGCCCGVEDWRDWFLVFDGGSFDGGHDPWALAEREGDIVRLTLDADLDDPVRAAAADSPVLDVPVDRVRELLAQAERDLVDFHGLATGWLRRQLPDHADAVSAALHRALDLR